MKVSKEIAKKIFIVGGIFHKQCPQWAACFKHYPQDKFPSIPANAEHCVEIADFYSHTKDEYIKKFFFGEIHVVKGGRNKVEEKLIELVTLLQTKESNEKEACQEGNQAQEEGYF